VKQSIQTEAIVLSRTDFGEADRIVTMLTPAHGKLRLMARGVRRVKSKLAGGIELFSISEISYIEGKGEIGTLISARLITHYGQIVQDIERVQLGYELIKILHRATEDEPEAEYYELLERSFAALDNLGINLLLIQSWFQAQLLKLSGHMPNLLTDTTDMPLDADQAYNFDIEAMTFETHASGRYQADHVKVLRLLFSHNTPGQLAAVQGIEEALPELVTLLRTMLQTYIRL